jgi:hypothetical protein
MRSTTKLFGFIFSLFLIVGAFVIHGSAQTRGFRVVRRPVIVRNYWGRDPFWHTRGWYDPWYDPYFNDPYLYERRERYYKEKSVKDASRKLKEDREKYGADGVITAKEQEKLAKRERDYTKAVENLRKFNDDSD